MWHFLHSQLPFHEYNPSFVLAVLQTHSLEITSKRSIRITSSLKALERKGVIVYFVAENEGRSSSLEDISTCKQFVSYSIVTVMLKVGVHCNDCKKKVQKALQDVKGIESFHIEEDKRKLTVMGNVDAFEILCKVRKVRKAAEFWPGTHFYSSLSCQPVNSGNAYESSSVPYACKSSGYLLLVLKMLQRSGLIM
eukprot:Gb_22111 [translate_table: standard]